MADTITASITITNVIDTGAAFAVRHGTGESCYIPATVMFTAGAKAGDVASAHLVDNPTERVRSRTPYMVTYLTTAKQAELPLQEGKPDPEYPPIAERAVSFVRDTMRDGGVWTVATLFAEFLPGEESSNHPDVYNTIYRTMRKMFTDGECAKWTLYRSSSQTKASKEWYGCYPDRADVDEYEYE